MAELPADLPGVVSWFKRVPPGWVEVFEIAGWAVEPVAPSHHDAHCILMRYGGALAADATPPIPTGRPRVRRSPPSQLQRRGASDGR